MNFSNPTQTDLQGNLQVNPCSLPRHILIGYWHNWQAEPTDFIRLKNVSPKFDVVNVAFATSTNTSVGAMTFTPYTATSPNQFRTDIMALQDLGKKVLISAGGVTGSVAITTAQAQQNFVDSMTAIIQHYGFDGIDINLEGKVCLDTGDTDFKTPTSPSIIYLIEAIRKIRSNFGPNFLVSLTPEMVNVQGGYTAYSGMYGAYLPVIEGLRDTLSYIQLQHYNSGALMGLDGKLYSPGTADFQVAMTEMLLQGFPVGGQAYNMFAAFKPEQIAIGLPALTHAAADGYTTPGDMQKALNYLTQGKSFGGHYVLRHSTGYQALRGVMTWSINWDAFNNFEFSTQHRAYLDALN